MERRQIEVNIQADEVVTEIIQSALTQLLILESRTPAKGTNKYSRALNRIELRKS